MAETRINLKHLLENLRDSYPFAIEEAILTELVANSLDSKADRIEIRIDPKGSVLQLVDNGAGMDRDDFRQYHDIAASTKVRGRGIGFAGMGAKLALLLCERVDTETRRKKVHVQSRWRLLKADRARWELCDPDGTVTTPAGTAVRLHFKRDSVLLDPDRVRALIQRHFRPLLDSFFHQVLCTVYPSPVVISVDGARVEIEGFADASEMETFLLRVPPRNKPAGIGFLTMSSQPLPEEIRGLAVSTYGKVIKTGWDWLTLAPRRPEYITGLVEVPDLATILTLNKADFMKTPGTVQKFYRYRSAIQRAVAPILERFGEVERKSAPSLSRPLERELEKILAQIIPEFPELTSLVGTHKHGGLDVPSPGSAPQQRSMIDSTPDSAGSDDDDAPSRASKPPRPADTPNVEPLSPSLRKPGLQVEFHDDPERADLGWISAGVIWINSGHPAFVRNQKSNLQSFHIAVVVAVVLSKHLLDERSPERFISEFLALWGRGADSQVGLYGRQSASDKLQ